VIDSVPGGKDLSATQQAETQLVTQRKLATMAGSQAKMALQLSELSTNARQVAQKILRLDSADVALGGRIDMTNARISLLEQEVQRMGVTFDKRAVALERDVATIQRGQQRLTARQAALAEALDKLAVVVSDNQSELAAVTVRVAEIEHWRKTQAGGVQKAIARVLSFLASAVGALTSTTAWGRVVALVSAFAVVLENVSVA
jgi:predicted  nucleic acid-binding Zn-ribbon protein